VIKKEAENSLNYTDLAMEIQCVWNVEGKVIPVIIWASGTISKSLGQYVSNVAGKHGIKERQTKVIHGTAHKLREVLMWKFGTFVAGEIT
jgi:hypothetical protein